MANLSLAPRRTRGRSAADQIILYFTDPPAVSETVEPGGNVTVEGEVKYDVAIGDTLEYQVRAVDVDSGDTWSSNLGTIEAGEVVSFDFSFPSGLSAGQSRQIDVLVRGRSPGEQTWFEGDRVGPYTVTAEEGGGGGGGGGGGLNGGGPLDLLGREDVQWAILGGIGGYYYATRTGEYRPRTAALAGAAGGMVVSRVILA